MTDKNQFSQMNEEEKYKFAKKRVEEIKGFYAHLITYLAVNVALFLIWYFTSGGDFRSYPWFVWVLGWWGFGLFWHMMGVFVFNRGGGTWEKKKIKEIMDQMDNK